MWSVENQEWAAKTFTCTSHKTVRPVLCCFSVQTLVVITIMWIGSVDSTNLSSTGPLLVGSWLFYYLYIVVVSSHENIKSLFARSSFFLKENLSLAISCSVDPKMASVSEIATPLALPWH